MRGLKTAGGRGGVWRDDGAGRWADTESALRERAETKSAMSLTACRREERGVNGSRKRFGMAGAGCVC